MGGVSANGLGLREPNQGGCTQERFINIGQLTCQQNARGNGKGKKGEPSKEGDKKNKEKTCHKCGETSHLRKDFLQKFDKEKDKDKDKEKDKEEFCGFAHITCANAFVHIELVE